MNIKSILDANKFRFNKGYGQNFLTDDNVLSAIVDSSGIDDGDTVIEIGCGAGTLTRHIASRAQRVIAFEIDTRLKPILEATLAGIDNVQVVYDDIMAMSMDTIEEYAGNVRFKVVANIPYYITSPLIMKFVEQSSMTDTLTLTIQKEVVDRLCASADCKDYGAITVAVNIVGDCTMAQLLPRELFLPPPNVDSAVVNIRLARDKFPIRDMNLLKQLIKCGFAMRRKTFVNNIINSFGYTREDAQQLLEQHNIDIAIRGESLSAGQYVELANDMIDRRHSI